MGFFGPSLGKKCMNLVKKLLPIECLTIIMTISVVRINGYRSQIEPVGSNGTVGVRKWC